MPQFTFNKTYFALTILIFLIELGIALFIRDQFIRPFVGDLLVVVLLYCFFKTFLNHSPLKVGIGVLLFAYTIEILQYFNFVEALGLQSNRILAVALGSTFDVWDLVVYTIGVGLVLGIESKTADEKKDRY